MKEMFRKISAILLVAILVASTSSFSIYKHFCGDLLVDVSLYTATESCCPGEVENHTEESDMLNFSKEDCCKNEIEASDFLTFETVKSLDIVKSNLVFVASNYFYQNNNNLVELDSKTNFYNNFSPPTIIIDKQIVYQSFLI